MASLAELMAPYPPPRAVDATDIRRAIDQSADPGVFVVLDDDPTGTQSVADLPVLTRWTVEDMAWAFEQGDPAVYVMTNSRSLSPQDAAAVSAQVVDAACRAAVGAGVEPRFVSRSDSTLRGHFPLEPDTIAAELERAGQGVDGVVLVPAFPEAGRITVAGTHYARVRDEYLPSGLTEYARDKTFGYSSSDLAEWVEEKTGGRTRRGDVVRVDLTTVRTRPDALLEAVMGLRDRQVLAPDIACEEDLRALCLSLIAAESRGRRFVYRVGPPFMRARIGQEARAPLTGSEIDALREAAAVRGRALVRGGLVVVGSHVGLTTMQLEHLVGSLEAPVLELGVLDCLDAARRPGLVQSLVEGVASLLESSTTVVVRTSRELVAGADAEDSLRVARSVSQAVTDVVRGILARTVPRYVVAKGGITSSDVASRGLSMRRARCVGPMLPGLVSLWAAQDGPAVGVPYVVFPGNVGGEDSLTRVVAALNDGVR